MATSFEDDGGYLHVQAVDLAVNFAQHVTQKVCEYGFSPVEKAVEKFFFEEQLASATFPRAQRISRPLRWAQSPTESSPLSCDIDVGGWRSCPAPGPPLDLSG